MTSKVSKSTQPLIRYPLDDNPFIEYHNKIESGEIVVSRKVARVYQELVRKITDQECKYYYSPKKANHVIEFVENYCKHSKSPWAGKPVKLELWQKALIAATFGMLDKETHLRMIRELILIIGRKNGKSLLGSALALYLLVADGEGGSEVVAVATKREQAKKVWGESVKMIKKSPSLLKRLQIRVGEVRFDRTESDYKPLASDSNSLDGLNAHGSLMDEIHAWNDKNLYDVIVDSMSTRQQPLNIIMTTAGKVRESIYDIKYAECESIINGYDDGNYIDDGVLPIIYELDNEKEVHDRNCWFKANPMLGIAKSFDFIETAYYKAVKNPVNMPNFLCKDFNMRQNGTSAWLSYADANNEATFDIEELKPKYCIGGFDLSRTTDLTSACIGFMLPDNDTIYYMHMYWMLASKLEERIEEDKVPYDIWVDKGYLRLCDGDIIDHRDIVNWYLEIQKKYNCYLYLVGYDSYSAPYLVGDMEDNFGKQTLVPVPQYAKVLSIPMEELGAKLKSKKVNYGNNPITKWCLMNTTVKTDTNGNIQPQKGINQKKRIDGLAAMLDSYVVLLNNRQDYYGAIGKYK